ncbi:hypothetical protein LCGC14_2768640 [marine sediment metagenome]|uniref:Uncharacterized protein n=1 Tax=marine sediment metagenome TaxID=412755 RepID=A0A0F8YWT4_9ZZZZ
MSMIPFICEECEQELHVSVDSNIVVFPCSHCTEVVEDSTSQAEALWIERAEKAEAALGEAIKQVATMSDEMGKVEAERDELRKQRDALVKIVHAGSVRSPGACALLAEIAKEEAGG